MENTALNSIAVTVFSISLWVFITPLLPVSPFVSALLPLGFLGFLAIDTLALNNRGALLLLDSLSPPTYRRRVLHHEAGHFLVAHLLKIPVTGYSLNAWEAFRQGHPGVGGVLFDNADLEKKVKNFPASLESFCTVWMAGIAAETLVYGRAEGGDGDRHQLRSALYLAGLPESARARKESQGLLQARTLLEKHPEAYDALVAAMERRATVEDIASAIDERLQGT